MRCSFWGREGVIIILRLTLLQLLLLLVLLLLLLLLLDTMMLHGCWWMHWILCSFMRQGRITILPHRLLLLLLLLLGALQPGAHLTAGLHHHHGGFPITGDVWPSDAYGPAFGFLAVIGP
jgi:hypothetical protein